MTTKNTGWPAFPTTNENEVYNSGAKGMSLRDYFAGIVIGGVFSNNGVLPRSFDLSEDEEIGSSEYLASIAYEMADAMLQERAK